MNATENTKSKSTEILRNFVALRDEGHNADEAIHIIAKASDTDASTILVALHYAITA